MTPDAPVHSSNGSGTRLGTEAEQAAAGQPFLSLGFKLTVPIVLLVTCVAVVAHFATARIARINAMRSKEAAVEMVVKLASFSTMPAVVFSDDVELNRTVTDLARNPEVLDVEVWQFDGSELAPEPIASFHRDPTRAIGRPESPQRRSLREQHALVALEPIVSQQGATIAWLQVRFSTEREEAAFDKLRGQFLGYTVVIAALLVLAILLIIGRLIVFPLRRLQKGAELLARSADDHLLPLRGNGSVQDEVSQLTSSFAEMACAVRDREAKLGKRNLELKLILDSVDQGFLSALADGSLVPEHSAIVETWVGPIAPGVRIWELIGKLDPALADWAEIAWEQLFDDVLPMDLALGQLPRRSTRGEQHFELTYHPIMNEDVLERVVVVVTDVTHQLERQRALVEQHEFSTLVERLVRDRRGFALTWAEARSLLGRIVDEGAAASDSLRRDLHTLKSGARALGMLRLADKCHALEDALEERSEGALNNRERAELCREWEALAERIEPLMQGALGFIEVSRDDYQSLLETARASGALDVQERLRRLREEPTASRLGRAHDVVAATCKSLGKTPARVDIQHHDLRLPSQRWAPLWAVLPHLLINSVDHGLESDEERAASGKPLPGTIVVSTEIDSEFLILEISDDGRGLDWERIRARATEHGLPHESREDLEKALFVEGLSLKSSVSDLSGRGVGLSAVQDVVTRLGGTIRIESEPGHGTAWRIRCPLLREEWDFCSLAPTARASVVPMPVLRA